MILIPKLGTAPRGNTRRNKRGFLFDHRKRFTIIGTPILIGIPHLFFIRGFFVNNASGFFFTGHDGFFIRSNVIIIGKLFARSRFAFWRNNVIFVSCFESFLASGDNTYTSNNGIFSGTLSTFFRGNNTFGCGFFFEVNSTLAGNVFAICSDGSFSLCTGRAFFEVNNRFARRFFIACSFIGDSRGFVTRNGFFAIARILGKRLAFCGVIGILALGKGFAFGGMISIHVIRGRNFAFRDVLFAVFGSSSVVAILPFNGLKVDVRFFYGNIIFMSNGLTRGFLLARF